MALAHLCPIKQNGIAIVDRNIPRHESDGDDHLNIDIEIEDFETMLLSKNTNPDTCTHSCRCPLSNPSRTLPECTNCKCQSGSCSMPKCNTNCKCQAGGCDMPKCTTSCKYQAGSCPIPVCERKCKCTFGGCFSSEQEELLLEMDQYIGAPSQTNHVPKLRGA